MVMIKERDFHYFDRKMQRNNDRGRFTHFTARCSGLPADSLCRVSETLPSAVPSRLATIPPQPRGYNDMLSD
jgi:hypothetical protein